MSSKRGRKRNDNLPPNRARDVQRAFRARRAAHLQALELRVSELEEENNCLRQALNLPPSNRLPLGKGPTGKDKPKTYGTTVVDGSAVQPLSFTSTSRESSIANSPGSRKSSPPIHYNNVSISPRPMQLMDSGSTWNSDILMGDGHQSDVPGPASSPYHNITPMAAPLPLKPSYSSYTSSSLPSSSRNSVSSDIYIPNSSEYSHSSDRPLSQSYSGQSFGPPRHYSYTHSFQTYGSAGIHSPSPSPAVPTLQSQSQHQQLQHHRDSPVSYAPPQQRRCMTAPQGFSVGQGFPELHHPSQVPTHHTSGVHHSARQSELIRAQDEVEHSVPSPRHHPYGLDGRLNHHPLP